jgi:hypothetical protein
VPCIEHGMRRMRREDLATCFLWRLDPRLLRGHFQFVPARRLPRALAIGAASPSAAGSKGQAAQEAFLVRSRPIRSDRYSFMSDW